MSIDLNLNYFEKSLLVWVPLQFLLARFCLKNSHFWNFCLEIITLTRTIRRGMKFATQISPLLNLETDFRLSLNFKQNRKGQQPSGLVRFHKDVIRLEFKRSRDRILARDDQIKLKSYCLLQHMSNK